MEMESISDTVEVKVAMAPKTWKLAVMEDKAAQTIPTEWVEMVG